MDFVGSTLHSFIIKLWLEDQGKDKQTVLHGHITHVPSGARRYLKSMSDITTFIREFVEPGEIGAASESRARHWLRRVTTRKPGRE